MASWIVPGSARCSWRSKWRSGVENWWILVQRGELIQEANAELVRHCWRAFGDAFWMRFRRHSWRLFVRGPIFVMFAWAALMLLLAVISRGFAMTRTLAGMANGTILTEPRWQAQETVFVHVVPIVVAAVIAAILVFLRRPPFRAYGWRYWMFLIVKTAAVAVAVAMFWIELAEVFRSWVPASEFRIIITGVVFRAIFIVVFSCGILWSFVDQRKRCPECLLLLGMPVRIGSSASVFEPVRIELLCERGHGLLCITEAEDGEDDEWTALDESWQEMFGTKV